MVELMMTNATARFECLQGDCPDTCCTGFRVGLSTTEHDRLATLLATHPETRNRNALVRLKRPHALTPNAPGGDASFAQENGQCVLLDPDGLCAVHRHFGEPALATVCSLYPRTVAEVEGERSVFLTLACPEAARLVLTDDQAFEPAPPESARAAVAPERAAAHRILEEQTFSLLRDQHKRIEAITLALDDDATSLGETLFFLAVFADALCEAQERGAEEVDATLTQFSEEQTATVSALRTAYLELPPPPGDDAHQKTAFAADLFATRLGQSPHPRFAARVAETLFEADADVTQAVAQQWFENRPAASNSTDDMVETVNAWQLTHADGKREEQILRAMVRHSLRTQWWIRATSPRHQVAVLMTRIALVRLLAAYDPRNLQAKGAATLDSVLVDAVQLVSKNITHVPTFARLVELALEERGFVSLEGSLALLPRDRH